LVEVIKIFDSKNISKDRLPQLTLVGDSITRYTHDAFMFILSRTYGTKVTHIVRNGLGFVPKNYFEQEMGIRLHTEAIVEIIMPNTNIKRKIRVTYI